MSFLIKVFRKNLENFLGYLDKFDRVFVFRLIFFIGTLSYIGFGALYRVYGINDPMPLVQRVIGAFVLLFALISSFLSERIKEKIFDVFYFVAVFAITQLVYLAYLSNYSFNYSLSILIVLLIFNFLLDSDNRLKLMNIYVYLIVGISFLFVKVSLEAFLYLFLLLLLGVGSFVISRQKFLLRQRYKELFFESPIGLVEVDSDGEILDFNQEITDTLGLSDSEKFKEYNVFDLFDIHPEENSFGEKQVKVNEKRVWIEFYLRELENDSIGDKRYILSCLDIEERKLAEEHEDLLHQILRHDVKNKLQIIKGYNDLLKNQELPKEAKKYLNKSNNALKEIINLINKIKALKEASKIEKNSVIDIKQVIEKAVNEKKAQADENNVSIEFEKKGCRVIGGSLFKELFSNLIENAIVHSECSIIKISACEKEKKCIVSVEDDGKGLFGENKQKIFKRGVKDEETGGTGLGLYLVKEIAQNYGGRIEVKDSELGGARFDVVLKKA